MLSAWKVIPEVFKIRYYNSSGSIGTNDDVLNRKMTKVNDI